MQLCQVSERATNYDPVGCGKCPLSQAASDAETKQGWF